MMSTRAVLLLALIAGVPALDSLKGSDAVDKVITMLDDLKAKTLEEGETEAHTYNEFACFCKDTSVEKSEAIKKGEDDKDSLTSKIESLSEDRDGLDDKIAKLTSEIEEAEAAVKDAEEKRAETLAVYETNAADLTGALKSLAAAIDAVKSAKSSSFVQIEEVKKTVQKAAIMAEALGLGNSKNAMAFLQQPMQNYDNKSGGVIKMLEKLQGDFRDTKADVDAAEVKSVSEFDIFKQEKTDLIARKTSEMETAKKTREQKIGQIGAASTELTTVAATLLDDQTYLKELTEICSAKAKTYDQRSSCRADELSALTAAIDIIKTKVAESTKGTIRFIQKGVSAQMAREVANSDEALEAIEAEAEEADAAPDFLQKSMDKPRTLLLSLASKHQQPASGSRQLVVDLLGKKGKEIQSSLLQALAGQISGDPLAKIKKLIQELIERLLQEAANEANQKGWCDKAIADAEQRRDYAAESIAELNAEMAELEATRDKLTEEIATLKTEIAELKAAQEKAEKERAAEKAENKATVEEATTGLEAVNMAIDILDKFYKTAKNKASLVQGDSKKGPLDDMPDAGFDAGETSAGNQGAAGGILGMMDVIKSDFERTISETEKAETEAEDDHMKFMTETGVSLAEKTMAEEQKTKQNDSTIEDLEAADAKMTAESEKLQKAIEEEIELQPNCVDTGMSYEERVARREQEIEALKKALCIFENGVEGAGEC